MNIRTTASQDNALSKELSDQLSFDWSALVSLVANIFEPQDLFSHEELAEWAKSNGFVEAEE